MREFSADERVEMYKELKNLCEDKKLLEKKISNLIDEKKQRSRDTSKNYRGQIIREYQSYIENKNPLLPPNSKKKARFLLHRDYFTKKPRKEIIEDITNEAHYKIMLIKNYFKDNLTQEILFICLDAIIEYNYFNDVIENKYDPQKIREDFEKIERFLQSDTKIEVRVPKHSQDIFRDTSKELIEEHNTNPKDTRDLLKQLLEDVNNYGLTKDTRIRRKKQTETIIKMFKDIYDNPNRKNNPNDEERKKEFEELEKYRDYYK
ncbi:MAG: hypothetical protein J7L21_07330 [Sulfurimonas sp.]|nr:hypothetical protein [Sulfurimonas sp.]